MDPHARSRFEGGDRQKVSRLQAFNLALLAGAAGASGAICRHQRPVMNVYIHNPAGNKVAGPASSPDVPPAAPGDRDARQGVWTGCHCTSRGPQPPQIPLGTLFPSRSMMPGTPLASTRIPGRTRSGNGSSSRRTRSGPSRAGFLHLSLGQSWAAISDVAGLPPSTSFYHQAWILALTCSQTPKPQ